MDEQAQPHSNLIVDGGPLGCGELLVLLHIKMRGLKPGDVMQVMTYDPGAHEDLPAWCRMTGHTLLLEQHNQFFIRKGE